MEYMGFLFLKLPMIGNCVGSLLESSNLRKLVMNSLAFINGVDAVWLIIYCIYLYCNLYNSVPELRLRCSFIFRKICLD